MLGKRGEEFEGESYGRFKGGGIRKREEARCRGVMGRYRGEEEG